MGLRGNHSTSVPSLLLLKKSGEEQNLTLVLNYRAHFYLYPRRNLFWILPIKRRNT